MGYAACGADGSPGSLPARLTTECTHAFSNGAADGSSVLYGGQGDDTLVAEDAGGDSMVGGAGSDLFVAYVGYEPFSFFTTNDLITVADDAVNNDFLSLSFSHNAQTTDPGGSGYLFKLHGTATNNAQNAFSAAQNYYAHDSNAAQFLLVYGGSGAGCLFYNGDGGGNAPNDGMILVGANGESSVDANHVIASPFA